MKGLSLGVKGSAVVVMVVVVMRVDVLCWCVVLSGVQCFFLSVCGRMSLSVYLDAHVSFVFSCVRGWTGRYVTFCGCVWLCMSLVGSFCERMDQPGHHFLCVWMCSPYVTFVGSVHHSVGLSVARA